jgi:hypothetical protein
MSALSIQPTYPIFTDIDGQPLEAGYVWLGTANLDPQTNPINVYWDAALTILAPQPIRTLAGYPSNSGTPARLYVNSDYSIRVMNKNGSVVYSAPAATERYNDVVVDGLNAEDVVYDPPFTAAVQTNVEAKLAQTVSVKDFGAVGDGIADDRAACQAAIDYVISAGGGTVVIPEGEYLINGTTSADSVLNGLLVPYTGQNGTANRVIIRGQGRSTVLKAGSNNMYVIRFSDNYGSVRDVSIDGNSRNAVYGLGCVPENVTQTTSLVFQNFNIFSGLYILNCAEGFTLRAGPDVGGADSGCWYNVLKDTHIYFCTRGIWMQDAVNASTSGTNRNNFINVRCGQGMNTGLQIDSADSCKFYGVNFEGINSGTSPNTTPTAIKIAQAGTFSGDNNSNTFIGCTCEACARDLDNFNALSEFYACVMLGSKVNLSGGANLGKTFIGGNGPSEVPEVWAGTIVQANGQLAGINNGITFFTQTGRAELLTNGRFQTTGSFQETNGSSGNIADAATFDVTIPTPKRPQLLFIYSSASLLDPGVYLVCGDSIANINVDAIISSGQVSLSSISGNQIQITNSSGVTANVRFTLTPFGVAAP